MIVSPATTFWPTDTKIRRVERQEHVHARTELHQADALAPRDDIARFDAAHDAARQQADDLAEDERPSVALDPQLVQLVVVRRFLVGRKKRSRPVVDARDAAADRRPVDVHVERRQEDGHLVPVSGRRPRLVGGSSRHHRAISRRHDHAGGIRNCAIGIPEEVGEEPAEQRRGPPPGRGGGSGPVRRPATGRRR